MRGSLRERIYARLTPCADEGCDCLLWPGAKTNGGYGHVTVGRRGAGHVGIHRAVWELENGPIPDGLHIDHVKERGCRHHNCANLAHLEPVTCRENLLRGDGFTAARAAQTQCVRGHEFTPANTYVAANGTRQCRTCHRERERARAQAQKASTP